MKQVKCRKCGEPIPEAVLRSAGAAALGRAGTGAVKARTSEQARKAAAASAVVRRKNASREGAKQPVEAETVPPPAAAPACNCRVCGRKATVHDPVTGRDHEHHTISCNNCGIEITRESAADAVMTWNKVMGGG